MGASSTAACLVAALAITLHTCTRYHCALSLPLLLFLLLLQLTRANPCALAHGSHGWRADCQTSCQRPLCQSMLPNTAAEVLMA
jgi:hypothetical protein